MSSPGKVSEDRPMQVPASPSTNVHAPLPLPKPAVPVAQPVPFMLDEPEERMAALSCELHPDDQKAVDALTPEQRRDFRYYLDVATSSASALVRGAAIVRLEKMIGREL